MNHRWRLRGPGWVALAALFGLTLLGGLAGERRSPVVACPVPGPVTVVLDPGHGGIDPGALNDAYSLVERELTLAVAERTAAILRADGHTVALTRTDNATALGNSERGRIANACGAQRFVSIHFNSFEQPDVNYTKTFWGIQEKDEAFSREMNATLVSALGPGTNLADGGVDEFGTGSLLQARMPGTLVESVFLSNPEEAARLMDPSGARLDAIAAAIAAGVEGSLVS